MRKSVCVCERESVCVCVREKKYVCERECVCVREREFVREIFREWGGANLLFEGGGQGMFI